MGENVECPLCLKRVPMEDDGVLRPHAAVYSWGSGVCPGSRRTVENIEHGE